MHKLFIATRDSVDSVDSEANQKAAKSIIVKGFK